MCVGDMSGERVINHRFDALDHQEMEPHVYFGFPSPHQISAFNSELLSAASDLVVATKPLSSPPAKFQSPDHALELLLLLLLVVTSPTSNMVWPLQGQEKRKPIQHEQFLFPGQKETMKFQKKKGRKCKPSNQPIP
jgi:hypothetical protein